MKREGTDPQNFYKPALVRNGNNRVSSADWSDAVASSTAAVDIWLAVIRRKLLSILIRGMVRVFSGSMVAELLCGRACAVSLHFSG